MLKILKIDGVIKVIYECIKVGSGPQEEPIFYVKELSDGIFEHFLKCFKLRKTAKILGQAGRDISKDVLEEAIVEFVAKL